MKKYIILGIILFAVLVSFSCKNTNTPIAPVKQEVKENVRYRLFPTENIWTFLKLDTRNGKIWQVQYSISNDNRGEIVLNNNALVSSEVAENGRFTLHPTQNMFNFILLDQTDGKMWQVQWSMEDGNRGIIPM